jgi:hypothetical protein
MRRLIERSNLRFQPVGAIPDMKLPCVRFTVRRLMIAVAVVAVLLGASDAVARLREQAFTCQLIAGIHALGEELHTHPEKYEGTCMGWAAPTFQADPRLDSKLAVYHAALRRKYESAAAHPWLAVDPDPPPPR